ncbi:penicillin-binding protein 2 [Pajaroellobacter abortibovis]|uniref:Penicillin-binding protein 2 n=1 Tax=Pajaroellobacter abortibovis TaxID=1882918 RepID=A0A1L6MVF1_9BACT|nr:penicillin-binding protein 2 [Pajaroellobacter abortibovis]APR99471.1 penicillin-binding protein 2 [Pajaroellobacter abortibovis]
MSDFLLSRADAGEFRKRYRWLILITLLAFTTILIRLFQLQILSHKEYEGIARQNIVRRVSLTTTRGLIRDAYGQVLATNRPIYNAFIVPGRMMLSSSNSQYNLHSNQNESWARLTDILRLNPSERHQFEQKMKTACITQEERSPCWRSIVIREDLPRDIIAELKQYQSELPGVGVTSTLIRDYPYNHLAAHTIGYLSEINPETLSRFRPQGYEHWNEEEKKKTNPLAYELGDKLGVSGVEALAESFLRGQKGWEKRIIDARGRYRTGPEIERLLEAPIRSKAIAGKNIRLTLDIELEQAIEKAFAFFKRGAAVVVEVQTGRLLALYSKPDFDLNELSGGGGRNRIREAFQLLQSNPFYPMLDRTMSGTFHPGSVFKPFTALALLHDNLVKLEETVECKGSITLGHRIFRCSHIHGKMTLREALAQSCNVYFFKVAERAGMDRIAQVASSFGLGEKTGIGMNAEAAGRIPTRYWYNLKHPGQFRIGLTLNTSIGQGDTMITPLQMALAYAAIANGDTLYAPQIIRSIERNDGSIIQDFPPRVRAHLPFSAEHLEIIKDGLKEAVTSPKGTAYPMHALDLDIAGKTGTAQTGGTIIQNRNSKLFHEHRDHAWFAGFAPLKSPVIAVVVLLEHGGSGPRNAVPIAMRIFQDYFRLSSMRSHTSPSTSTPTTDINQNSKGSSWRDKGL